VIILVIDFVLALRLGLKDGNVDGFKVGILLTLGERDGLCVIVGILEGFVVGTMVGWDEGKVDGDMDGLNDGIEDGRNDGVSVGSVDGDMDGNLDGDVDGDMDGNLDGDVDGDVDGDIEGKFDGKFDGRVEGELYGTLEGWEDELNDGVELDSLVMGSPSTPLKLVIFCSLSSVFFLETNTAEITVAIISSTTHETRSNLGYLQIFPDALLH